MYFFFVFCTFFAFVFVAVQRPQLVPLK